MHLNKSVTAKTDRQFSDVKKKNKPMRTKSEGLKKPVGSAFFSPVQPFSSQPYKSPSDPA
jgi:hypothetical protein